MSINPGHNEPHGGPFRPPMSAPTPPADATPTQRLTSFRQPNPQRIIKPPTNNQPARTQRTRRTVDLPAATHRALDIWQREAADRLGVARVTGQEVLTALIDQLLIDPKLAAQVTRAIQTGR
ncbi:MAG: ATPase [Mycobacterium sp.]